VRATLFAGLGGAHFEGTPFKVYTSSPAIERPTVGFDDVTGARELGAPVLVDGFRLVDARASYGISLSTMAIGFPVHFDWSWKTLMNKAWEDVQFAQVGGSEAFRKVKFTMWIGYDW
jgi:hypothetical protein